MLDVRGSIFNPAKCLGKDSGLTLGWFLVAASYLVILVVYSESDTEARYVDRAQ